MHGKFRAALGGFDRIKTEIFNVFNGCIHKYHDVFIPDIVGILYVQLEVAVELDMLQAFLFDPGLQFIYQPVTQAIVLTARVTIGIYQYVRI